MRVNLGFGVRWSLVCLTSIFLLGGRVGAQESEPKASASPMVEPIIVEPIATVTTEGVGKVTGVVLERGRLVPLRDVGVFILPHRLKATTDQKGQFVFDAVPAGPCQLAVNAAGFVRNETNLTVVADETVTLGKTLMEREPDAGFETLVSAKKIRRDDSTKSLDQKEFLSLPGAGGDPVKAVQNLPGVNRVQSFSSQVVIQGSSPQDTKYNVDGHDVPLVFHFGGLTSVVMPEAVEQVDYLSAGYGPEYSRAMGGIISLKTRDAEVSERDSKGFFFFDTLKAGGLFETKLSEDSSLLVSARYSYVGLLLAAIAKDNDAFDLTVAPEFMDFTVIGTHRLNDQDRLRIIGLASRDVLEFLLKEPVRADPGLRGSFKNETVFYRLIPQWERKYGDGDALRVSMGVGQDSILADLGDNYFKAKTWVTTARVEREQFWSADWKAFSGLDLSYGQANVDVRLPILKGDGGVGNPISSGKEKEVSTRTDVIGLGAYLRNEWKPDGGAWTWMPSARFDYFNLTKQSLLAPRFGFKYQHNPDLLLKGATGLYYQAPEPQQVNSSFGNPDIKAPSAIHLTTGFEQDLHVENFSALSLGANLFDREFQNLVVDSKQFIQRDGVLVPEIYNNEGRGRAYGAEILLKGERGTYSGWIAYTWSQSTRWDPNRPEYKFAYDQTHNINLIGAKKFSNDWKVSGRYRYVTGNPYTPVLSSVFDADNDTYIPMRGPIYSERLGAFSQLDLRIDKIWTKAESIYSAYLDIQNLLNTKNPESLRYAYDYSRSETISGLPVLVALGLKIDL